MSTDTAILLVDDEDSFLRATAELLTQEGYQIVCAPDVVQGLGILGNRAFDLMIADIRMPGNDDLRLVQEARRLAPGMPIVLMTGYPSVETATRSIEFSVAAYLIKPVPYPQLLKTVRQSLADSEPARRLSRVVEHLKGCVEDLEACLNAACTVQSAGAGLSQVTVRTLGVCVGELYRLGQGSWPAGECSPICELVDCSRARQISAALSDAVDVLQETKHRFKSKELAGLRDRLDRLRKSLTNSSGNGKS